MLAGEQEVADIVGEEVRLQVRAALTGLGETSEDRGGGSRCRERTVRIFTIGEREVVVTAVAGDARARDELLPVAVKIDGRQQVAVWSEDQEAGERLTEIVPGLIAVHVDD